MSNRSFFDGNAQGQHAYDHLLQKNEINARNARIKKSHQALDDLEKNIESRREKLQEIFIFLDNKQTLYQQLTEQYQQQPSPELAARIEKLKQAINELVANIEKTQPKEVIAELFTRFKELQSELARKEALFNDNVAALKAKDATGKSSG